MVTFLLILCIIACCFNAAGLISLHLRTSTLQEDLEADEAFSDTAMHTASQALNRLDEFETKVLPTLAKSRKSKSTIVPPPLPTVEELLESHTKAGQAWKESSS